MTPADGDWLEAALELAATSGLSPLEEAELRFSIGKYYDDIGEFDEAFRSYEAANRLLEVRRRSATTAKGAMRSSMICSCALQGNG